MDAGLAVVGRGHVVSTVASDALGRITGQADLTGRIGTGNALSSATIKVVAALALHTSDIVVAENATGHDRLAEWAGAPDEVVTAEAAPTRRAVFTVVAACD